MTSLNTRREKQDGEGKATNAVQERPLYQRIEAAMRTRIADGEWPAGRPLPSRVQLCEEFGTTRVTLDKAITGLVREGLLRSTRGSGTFVAGDGAVAPAARTLRVGVVIGQAAPEYAPGVENHYYGPLFQGIRDAFAAQTVEAIYSHHEPTGYEAFYSEAGLDGMILTTPLLSEMDALHALAAAGIAYVSTGISSRAPGDLSLPCVDTDNRQGASDAVHHLLSQGHRRIGLVNLATSQANHHDRLEGYQNALSEAGLSVQPGDLLLYPFYEEDRLEERVAAWLGRLAEESTLPTALFCCDYLMTLAALRVLRHLGRRVPEDVSVVGFDDPFSAAHLTPALTTVRQPVYQMGRRAAERLLDALRAGCPPHGNEILPTQLIVRESTRPLIHYSSLQKEGVLR